MPLHLDVGLHQQKLLKEALLEVSSAAFVVVSKASITETVTDGMLEDSIEVEVTISEDVLVEVLVEGLVDVLVEVLEEVVEEVLDCVLRYLLTFNIHIMNKPNTPTKERQRVHTKCRAFKYNK